MYPWDTSTISKTSKTPLRNLQRPLRLHNGGQTCCVQGGQTDCIKGGQTNYMQGGQTHSMQGDKHSTLRGDKLTVWDKQAVSLENLSIQGGRVSMGMKPPTWARSAHQTPSRGARIGRVAPWNSSYLYCTCVWKISWIAKPMAGQLKLSSFHFTLLPHCRLPIFWLIPNFRFEVFFSLSVYCQAQPKFQVSRSLKAEVVLLLLYYHHQHRE